MDMFCVTYGRNWNLSCTCNGLGHKSREFIHFHVIFNGSVDSIRIFSGNEVKSMAIYIMFFIGLYVAFNATKTWGAGIVI